MFERIDTICLTVSNLEQSSTWYRDLLGFKETFKGVGYQVLSLEGDGVSLTIEEGNKSTQENQTYPILFTNDIRKAYMKLKEQGVNVTEIQNDGDNNFFDFYDLDNNKLQVCFWE